MVTGKQCLSLRPATAVAIAVLAFATMPAAAGECSDFTSASATPDGEFRLCERAVGDVTNTYACRTYRDGQFQYETLFRGGPVPKAVHLQSLGGGESELQAVASGDVKSRSCRQAPPTGVPSNATYRGTGVCVDAHDRPLPCSVYEHAAAREPDEKRYFVYYEPHGGGVHAIDAIVAGPNRHSLEAEFAFQLGRAVAESGCCAGQAEGYLAHAAALFPEDPIYRDALRAHVSGSVRSTGTPLAVSSPVQAGPR